MAETIKQEVTLAVIGIKLDNLTEKFDAQAATNKEYKEKMESRMRIIEDKMLKLESDQTTGKRVLTAISIFLSAFAAYLGIRF